MPSQKEVISQMRLFFPQNSSLHQVDKNQPVQLDWKASVPHVVVTADSGNLDTWVLKQEDWLLEGSLSDNEFQDCLGYTMIPWKPQEQNDKQHIFVLVSNDALGGHDN